MINIQTAEVITIGDEILIGQITDTNTQFISNELEKLGIKTVRKSSVGDDKSAIISILKEAFERADIIITTGGLGPTKDDITKHTIAEYFNSELIIHKPTLEIITELLRRRGKDVSELNHKQALVPACCQVILNQNGTAPCMWIESQNKILVSMPGVPFEMKELMTGGVKSKILPFVSQQTTFHKTILTSGIGESDLATLIQDWEDKLPDHIKLAYLPSLGCVRLRLSGNGDKGSNLEKEISELFLEINPLIKSYIVDETSDNLEEILANILLNKGLTISTAESCTGGGLAAKIVQKPGSSRYFKGGIVAYDNVIKEHILKVPQNTLINHGAVSEECVIEMAKNVVDLFQSDLGVAISGIAGPDGGTESKPVGTIWMAFSNGKTTITKKILGVKLRETNINYAITQALVGIIKFTNNC